MPLVQRISSFPVQKGMVVVVFPFRVISEVVFESKGWGKEAIVPE